MGATINPIDIFLPVLAVVALSVFGLVRLLAARNNSAKELGDAATTYYRAYVGGPEPEYAVVAARHYNNLFEAPVLFYAGCITGYAIGAVSMTLLVCAWGYVALRLVQSAVHLSVNNPILRGFSFTLSWLFLIALWVTLALAIFARM